MLYQEDYKHKELSTMPSLCSYLRGSKYKHSFNEIKTIKKRGNCSKWFAITTFAASLKDASLPALSTFSASNAASLLSANYNQSAQLTNKREETALKISPRQE